MLQCKKFDYILYYAILQEYIAHCSVYYIVESSRMSYDVVQQSIIKQNAVESRVSQYKIRWYSRVQQYIVYQYVSQHIIGNYIVVWPIIAKYSLFSIYLAVCFKVCHNEEQYSVMQYIVVWYCRFQYIAVNCSGLNSKL